LSSDPAQSTRSDARVAAIVLLLVIAATAWWWRPSPDGPVTNEEALRKIGSVAASLETSIEPIRFAMLLDSLTRYPPLPSATEDLARALAACDVVASLGAANRDRLALGLWQIMNGGQLTATELARTLLDLQQTAAKAGCSPDRVEALTEAGYAAARNAQDQRRDWW
jgi:hypothetical protein